MCCGFLAGFCDSHCDCIFRVSFANNPLNFHTKHMESLNTKGNKTFDNNYSELYHTYFTCNVGVGEGIAAEHVNHHKVHIQVHHVYIIVISRGNNHLTQ